MKKLRRLVTDPVTGDLKMKTLYEYHGKVGTGPSTIVWLLDKAVKDEVVYAICLEDRYTPYMEGHAFRYAPFNRYKVTEIQFRNEEEHFIMISKI